MTDFAIPDRALREIDEAIADERLADALYAVDRNAPTDWKAAANEAVRVLMVERGPGAELCADDVWYKLEACGVKSPPDLEPRALGSLMSGAGRRGWLVDTGRQKPTTRVTRNKGVQRIWQITELGAEQTPKRLLPKPSAEATDLGLTSAPGGSDFEIGDGFIRIGRMTLYRESRGYGLVCSGCGCEVDAKVRGPHLPECPLRSSNQSLGDDAEVFEAYEASR